jgi:hypothetical protein
MEQKEYMRKRALEKRRELEEEEKQRLLQQQRAVQQRLEGFLIVHFFIDEFGDSFVIWFCSVK